jgi:hypothetical protein
MSCVVAAVLCETRIWDWYVINDERESLLGSVLARCKIYACIFVFFCFVVVV